MCGVNPELQRRTVREPLRCTYELACWSTRFAKGMTKGLKRAFLRVTGCYAEDKPKVSFSRYECYNVRTWCWAILQSKPDQLEPQKKDRRVQKLLGYVRGWSPKLIAGTEPSRPSKPRWWGYLREHCLVSLGLRIPLPEASLPLARVFLAVYITLVLSRVMTMRSTFFRYPIGGIWYWDFQMIRMASIDCSLS